MPQLPSGATSFEDLLALFDQADQTMLITGSPGSGKSFEILGLARLLIQRARSQENQLLPVILNLASWPGTIKLEEWIEAELQQHYNFPRAWARTLLPRILPLLDGLDEVGPQHQEACVRAINDYRDSHPGKGLVIGCREEFYAGIRQRYDLRLKLQSCVRIGELNDDLVDRFLHRAGPPLAGVRFGLKEDASLRELVRSPLMLFMLSFAWWGKSLPQIKAFPDTQSRRKDIYEQFALRLTNRCLVIRSPWFLGQHVLYWLAALARKMKQLSITHFLYERLQPSWLAPNQLGAYFIGSRILTGGLITALVFVNPFLGLLVGTIIGFLIHRKWFVNHGRSWRNALIFFLITFVVEMELSFLAFSKKEAYLMLLAGIDPEFAIVISFFKSLMLVAPVVPAFLFSVLFCFRMGNSLNDDLMPVELMVWSWQDAASGFLRGLIFAIPVGAILGILMGQAIEATDLWEATSFPGIFVGINFASFYPLIGGVLAGYKGKRADLEALGAQTGEGLKRATHNMIRSGLTIGLAGTL